MFIKKTVRVVIEKANSTTFKVTWKTEKFTGEFKRINGKDVPVARWVDMQTFKFGKWSDVQNYLDENVDLVDVYVVNTTPNVINFAEISNSGRRRYY